MRKARLGDFSLGLILLGAFAIRAVAGEVSLGADHPNETYRLLEPLAALSGFATRLPWEWTDGLLSQLPVRALAAVLAPLSWAGASPLAELLALKFLFALLSLLPIVATWRLLRPHSRGLATIGATCMALWPEMIYRSVRLMDYSLEAALLAAALIFAFTIRARRIALVGCGIALGLAFFVRFQSGLYFLAIFGGIFLVPPVPSMMPSKKKDRESQPLRDAAILCASYGITIMVLGGYEALLTGAAFLSPFTKYLGFNWVENGAAKFYGVAPWHRYFSEAAKAYGVLPFPLLLLAGVWAAKSEKSARGLALAFFLPFVALSLLAHKEGRFAYGFLWVLIPLALSAPLGSLRSRRPIRIAASILLLAGLGINSDRILRRLYAGADDVRQWAALAPEISRAWPAQNGSPLIVVSADPDSVPGGFFLRFHGLLCYEYTFDGQPRHQGACDGGKVADGRISRRPSDGRWELSPLKASR